MTPLPTVQTVIDALTANRHTALPEPTVDQLLIGDPGTPVTGIVTTFMPTLSVVQQARSLGANLVIGHEGLFFSHHERSEESPEGEIERMKRQQLEASDVAVFRLHDSIHRYCPDGITEGLVAKLGWSGYVREYRAESCLLDIPSASLREIATEIKTRLGLPYITISGHPEAVFSRVGLLAGYRGGGTLTIPLLESKEADLIVYGEGPEWETPEYVREAMRFGRHCGLIALGHAASEEPGMERLAEALSVLFPHIPVHYLQEEPSIRIL
ncbi:Nif3-like dinuclear metal center hexameric protein [Saccharibacillus sacchari]|uniref:Nif3-like dinuclear metal center hexameric protein n=1 Tax=Saccharibacillus sacchari TaxID=456493 RepID=A0ACC6PES9_9BACL